MVDRYIPGFTNMLMRPDLLEGGPAYVDMMPGLASLPAEETVPYANPFTPQDDFLERIRQAEAMAQAEAPVYTPDMGALNMLMRPDLFGGGPAYADMMPGAMPEQVSMLPFAPEAPAPQPMQQPMTPPSGLGGRQNFMDERDIFMGDAPDRFSLAASNTLANAPQRDPVTGLLLNAQGQPGFQFMTDRGRLARYGKSGTGFITADPNAQYRMWDERGKNRVVAEGTGVDALQNIYNLANQFNTEQGKKANWGIERLNPTTGRWERVAENDPAGGGIGGFLGDVALGAGVGLLGAATGGLGLAALPAALGGAAIGGGLNAAGVNVTDVALPVAANFLLPGSGFLGAAAPAALGSAASSALQGRSLEDTLLRAAITGGTAGFLGGTPVGQKITGAVSNFAGDTVNAVLGKVAAEEAAKEALEEIVVSASRGALPSLLTSGASAGAGSLASQLANMAPGNGADFADRVFQEPTTPAVQTSPLDTVSGDPINVLANRVPTGGALPVASAGAGIMAQAGVDAARAAMERQAEPEREGEPITVTADRITNMAGGTPSLGAVPFVPSLPGKLSPVMPEATPNEIVVTDTKKPVVPSIPVTAPLPYAPTITGTPSADPNEIVVTDTKQPTAPAVPLTPADVASDFDKEFGKKSLGEQLQDRIKNLDAADYLRLAGVLLPLLDGGGGGRRGALSTIPSGMFGRSSVFGGSLPRATMPGASTGFAPRAPSALGPQTTQDYYRYGYGPAQSFFDYVPQGQPNTSRAFTGYEQAQAREDQGFYLGGMAGGGDMSVMPRNSFAVNGPGTGRSDEIPAMLSDGEYVMDAETVALLGDGSPKAGANRLDQFRINVRKDKGRNLVKGEFSANAKRPEHYLKGGRA